MTQFVKRPPPTHRARDHLVQAGQIYSQAWADIEHMRTALRGNTVPDWPAWCYIPLAGAQAAVADDARIDVRLLSAAYPERIADAARVAGLAAWRMTQGIYRFDPAMYEAVRTTPVTGDIPHELLERLPEWCVYVETPDLQLGAVPVRGAFAHLEHDRLAARRELRLLLDVDVQATPALAPLALHLGAWGLAEALQRMQDAASVQALGMGWSLPPGADPAHLRAAVEPIMSMLLYLCASPADIEGKRGRPGNPEPTRTRRDGWKLFPADGVRTWDVGVRMGAALRAAYAAAETGGDGTRGGPRGHVRRAHWHGFRSGPIKRADGSDIPAADRKFELRWLPPIPVNLADAGDLPATIKPVRGRAA